MTATKRPRTAWMTPGTPDGDALAWTAESSSRAWESSRAGSAARSPVTATRSPRRTAPTSPSAVTRAVLRVGVDPAAATPSRRRRTSSALREDGPSVRASSRATATTSTSARSSRRVSNPPARRAVSCARADRTTAIATAVQSRTWRATGGVARRITTRPASPPAPTAAKPTTAPGTAPSATARTAAAAPHAARAAGTSRKSCVTRSPCPAPSGGSRDRSRGRRPGPPRSRRAHGTPATRRSRRRAPARSREVPRVAPHWPS